MKLYFTDDEHEKAFNELRALKKPDRGFDYADYMLAYYVLTSDKNLRLFLPRFLDKVSGDIRWRNMLESNMVYKDYRQVVAFAQQLYTGGCKNNDFDFIMLLEDLRGKHGVLNTVLEAARLYSSQTFLNRLVV